jgi:bisphosphoglycerate-dependent phosphoglycerate mutase family 1
MERKLKIYLFRHGLSTYNRDHRFTGWHDAKLTKEGIEHAKIIAKKLKNKKFEVAVHTSLSRSKETLKHVLIFHPECHLILEDDRMIERSYGVLEGMGHEEYIKKVGNLIAKESGINYTDEEKYFLGEREYDVIHRGYKSKALNAESFYDVELRVKNFISDLKKLMKKYEVNVAISAHGNSIRLFRKIMEKASIETMKKWFIPYDKIFEYSI